MASGLLLIDFQNDYFPGGADELVGIEEAAGKAAQVLARAREQHVPIVHMQHVSLQPNATVFVPYTKGVEIEPRIAPAAGEPVILKHYPNAFRETVLASTLWSAGVSELFVCGATTHLCIDASTRAAADIGFRCTVIADACATRDLTFENRTIDAAEVQGAFLAALGMVYARILRADEVSFM